MLCMSGVRPIEIEPHERWREYCQFADLRFFFVPFGSTDFDDVLRVRAAVYGNRIGARADETDGHSEHYLCASGGRPLAALRVTRAACGPLDCQEFLPGTLLAEYGGRLGSASRFVALRDAQGSTKIAQLVVEAAWRDQLGRGIRLDVMNVHERAVKYYGKLGYELLAESFFVHPKWKTPSRVMLFPATANRDTPIRPVFEALSDPLELETLTRVVSLSPWAEFMRSKISRAEK